MAHQGFMGLGRPSDQGVGYGDWTLQTDTGGPHWHTVMPGCERAKAGELELGRDGQGVEDEGACVCVAMRDGAPCSDVCVGLL